MKLDSPVWHSLNENHADYSVNRGDFKFYKPQYCSFGASDQPNSPLEKSSEYINDYFVVGEKPVLGKGLEITGNVLCDQMVMESPLDWEFSEEIIQLNESHRQQLSDLVNLALPGYFMPQTAELGDYFGIFKDGKLAAATGERMSMEGFTEVSSVVAHPDYHRKGLAKQLVIYTAAKILAKNRVPFLHTAEANVNAINLYERLGFRFRRKMNFWKIKQS
jgi:ribosomal protein S18 acetylase RimI-like enzyme